MRFANKAVQRRQQSPSLRRRECGRLPTHSNLVLLFALLLLPLAPPQLLAAGPTVQVRLLKLRKVTPGPRCRRDSIEEDAPLFRRQIHVHDGLAL